MNTLFSGGYEAFGVFLCEKRNNEKTAEQYETGKDAVSLASYRF